MIDLNKHEKGNNKCSVCFLNRTKICSCGGLIHSEWAEEYIDRYIYSGAIFKCDKCGKMEGD